MNNVKVQTTIDASVEEVWRVLADFGGIQKWAPSVTNSYSLSENNGGPEAARHCDVAGFGGIQEYITEWKEGSGFTYRVTGVGPIKEAHSKWSAEAKDGKTVVTTTVDYSTRFGPLGSVLNALVLRRKLLQGIVLGHAGLQHHILSGETVGIDFRAPASA